VLACRPHIGLGDADSGTAAASVLQDRMTLVRFHGLSPTRRAFRGPMGDTSSRKQAKRLRRWQTCQSTRCAVAVIYR
jgi:hypothetical protein